MMVAVGPLSDVSLGTPQIEPDGGHSICSPALYHQQVDGLCMGRNTSEIRDGGLRIVSSRASWMIVSSSIGTMR